ncbi:HlyD family efflux transporter periplasmic adaptor subunit [Melaminivora sp.]
MTSATPASAAPSAARRKKTLLTLAALVAAGGLAWAAYDLLVASQSEHTDNAYVQGHVVQVTPQVGGSVLAIAADDTDFVRAGTPLVQLDPADTRVALAQAEAALGQTLRQTRTLYANNASLAAQVQLRQAEAQRAQADIERAQAEVQRVQSDIERLQDDLRRRQQLASAGAVSSEELQHTQSQLRGVQNQLAGSRAAVQAAQAAAAAAQAGILAAREQLASNRALTQGVALQQHPAVQAAAARLREAWLAHRRMQLLAPVDGYVARRNVQLGQRVAAGTPLMSVVPLHQVWVDANFKENQLRNLRLGQPATLTADLYGKKIRYQGRIAGLGVGTGAAFALLPAQNATGNWIKVVQRVPVRITLDAAQLNEHPLRVGLSMDVQVDTHDRSGSTLAEAPRTDEPAQTRVFEQLEDGADAEVARIIAAQLGQS